MSLATQLPYGLARILYFVVLFPWTHVLWPCLKATAFVIQHSLVIPVLLIVRTFLFGGLYLPLLPVLRLINVDIDGTVPVEKALYRLVCAAWPHFQVLLGHLFHYLMVSIFLGASVGIVAGINISIVSRVFRLLRQEERKTDLKNARSVSVYPFGLLDRPILPSHSALRNTPRVLENSADAIIKQEDLPVGDMLYEDDDGYNYMTLGPSDNSSDSGDVLGLADSSLLSTTIIEESEPETSQFPSLASPLLYRGQHGTRKKPNDSVTYSTGYTSVSSVFSPAEGDSTGASESNEQETLTLPSPVKEEPEEHQEGCTD